MSADAVPPGPDATEPADPRVTAFVERLGSTFTQAGFPRLPARVFSALLADDDGRMTAAELAEQLRVSPASVSGAVRYLAEMHLLHREREPGTRRDVFVVRDEAWHDMMLNAGRIYEPFIRVIAEGIPLVAETSERAGRRLEDSHDFLEFIAGEVGGIAERWEARRGRTSQ